MPPEYASQSVLRSIDCMPVSAGASSKVSRHVALQTTSFAPPRLSTVAGVCAGVWQMVHGERFDLPCSSGHRRRDIGRAPACREIGDSQRLNGVGRVY
jgi:hypothetical protein